MLTVSVPVHRTPPELVDRAVRSCLANDAVELVVVTGDGADPGYRSDDRRVLVWSTSDNRGRYFVDDVVSRACRTPYFTVHDADDWSDPGRLDALVAAAVDVAMTDRETTGLDGRVHLRPARSTPGRPVDIVWGLMAVYRSTFVRGLFHPGFRVSWDAIVDNVSWRYGSWAKVDGYLYRIAKRPGSLTTDPATRLRSDYRKAVTVAQRAMWAHAELLSDLDDVKAYFAATVAPQLADRRDAELRRLEALL